MDENKNSVNGNTQNTNDMNYSFDFANQVQDDTPKNDVPITPDATVTVSDEPVVSETSMDTPTEIPQTPVTEVTNVMPQNSVSETTDQTVSVETNVATGDTIVPASDVPVTPETTIDNKEEDSIELIKDKKATKNFLIGLFVVLIIFIIALPFIFNIMGSMSSSVGGTKN